MAKAEFVKNVKGLGRVYRYSAPGDEQLKVFGKVGIDRFVSTGEAVIARLDGVEDFTRACVAPIAIEGEIPILVKYSPLMNPLLMALALNAHRQNQYPDFFPVDLYAQARQDARTQENLPFGERTAFVLPTSDDFQVTPNSETAKFLGIVPEYFVRFHKSNPKITFYNLPKNVPRGQCRVNYLWFNGPSGGSDLYARYQYLDNDNCTLGVRRGGARSAGTVGRI